MPHVTTDDKVRLHYEEAGSGFPVLFIHEFAGDHRSWEPQVRHFARHYRCVVYAARGYPPSDVPRNVEQYSQARAVADAVAVLNGLGIKRAHVVGLSMGGYCALNLAIGHPGLVRSVVIAGCGYGSEPDRQAEFRANSEAAAKRFETLPIAEAARVYADVPTRWPLRDKDPRGWAEFQARLAEHDPLGAAMTLRGVQMRRKSIWDLVPGMRAMPMPALVITGDRDEYCIAPGVKMRAEIPNAGLLVLPHGGHAINLEEPEAFNHALATFFLAAEQGRWGGTKAVGG